MIVIIIGIAIMSLLFIHSCVMIKKVERGILLKAEIVKVLGLTDLCIFTEARYTRNPSVADLHTPFQDHPLSLEHFPSGSLIAPSGRLKR